jgi:hypothetical protein
VIPVKSEATPRPWATGLQLGDKHIDMHMSVYCDDSLGSRVADCSNHGHGITTEQALANAALIVECVNSHSALLAQNSKLLEGATQAHKLLGSLCGNDIHNATARDAVGAAFVHLSAALAGVTK